MEKRKSLSGPIVTLFLVLSEDNNDNNTLLYEHSSYAVLHTKRT